MSPDVAMEQSCGSILERGFLEAAKLQYSYADNTALLTEGNTRLAFSKAHNIEYIPVTVIPVNGPLEGATELVQGEVPRKQWLVASDLHLPTVNDDRHPYFPIEVEKMVFEDVDPPSWLDKSIDIEQDELLVAFERLSLNF